jgi:hypothetical protein
MVADGGLREGWSGAGCGGGEVLAPCKCSLRGASLLVLLAPWWCSGGGVDEGAAAVASKRSRHGGGGGSSDEGVPAQGAVAKGSWHGGGSDGVPVVATCALFILPHVNFIDIFVISLVL